MSKYRWSGMALLKRSKGGPEVRVLFVDAMNDLSSQLAEYYCRQLFSNKYQMYSAGPKHDIIDCDLLSTMYTLGEDLRDQVSKDFSDDRFLPEDGQFDFVIYTDGTVFDKLAKKSPWQGKQIRAHLGRREEFTCSDDAELAEEMAAMADRVRKWVSDNMDDPEKLKSLVTA